jgi:Restriction endonuclease BglII
VRIAATYSHLNGLEYLLVHKPKLWKEITAIIDSVDAEACRTKVSKEMTKQGKVLYSPKALNAAFKAMCAGTGWSERKTCYWVTEDAQLIRRTMSLPRTEQKELIIQAGRQPYQSFNQTDFVKDRVAVEVQFGKYSFVAYDLFVKHMAFFVGDLIDVGVEILPMHALQAEMSSGVARYESELYNLVRQGRGVPAVPLVLVGIAP